MTKKTFVLAFFLVLLPIRFSSAALVEKIPIGNGNFLGRFDINGHEVFQVILGTLVVPAVASELSLKDQIRQHILTMADFYDANSVELIAVSNCESDWLRHPDNAIIALGDSDKSLGLFQFYKGWNKGKWVDTFANFAKQGGVEGVSRNNWMDQVEVASWAFAQGESYKKHWTCYQKMFVEQKW